jgi:VIT1/CCC1 family predicted Fe2+/Mn2+ transporter
MTSPIDEALKARLLIAQKNEITEHHIYQNLASRIRDAHNRDVLGRIAQEEYGHYSLWKEYTGEEVSPDRLKIGVYSLITRVFGLTFGIKLMEKGEDRSQVTYAEIRDVIPDAARILADEEEHEQLIIGMINEERLKYVGSIVLGLNDALVELTGTLAGLTFALQDTRLIALVGLITGIAASLSMGASEYLSEKAGAGDLEPFRASLYTGGAYVITVLFLIMPFLLIEGYLLALGLTLVNAIIVIFCFTFYISVAKDLDFRRRLLEMLVVSMGVAGLSFAIGVLIRMFLGVDV